MSEPFAARRLLLPLVPLYRLGLVWREFRLRSRPPRNLQWPVVSIGNLSTGGAGKTPLTIALAQALTRRGLHVDVLSRGYGRRSALPLLVAPCGTAEEFGDEPLLIAREAGVPVYVAAERHQAGLLAESTQPGDVLKGHAPLAGSGQALSHAESAGALKGHDRGTHAARGSRAENQPKSEGALAPEGSSSGLLTALHLLDDGFQHRQLARNLDILLLNRADLNGHLLPAGNLREPLRALHRASVIAIPSDEPELESDLKVRGWTGPLWRLRRQMDVPKIAGPVVAFCGIARPEQFFTGLAAAGLHLGSRIAFRDHHRYVRHDIDCLLDAARSISAAALVTTEKDRVRLGALAESIPVPLHTARLHVEIENQRAALDWLVNRLR